ncbi:hypothetical protein Tco_1136793, partial [Tanacetum coccineum]
IAWVSTGEVEEKKEDDDVDDDKSVDIKETNDEETDDEFVQGNEYVQDDVDEEMKDVEVADTGKGKEEISDAAKAYAENTKEVKDDQIKDDSAQDNQATVFAFTTQKSSSLSVLSGFGNQFLNLSSDTYLIGTTKESADTEINSLLDIQIQQEVPHIQSPFVLIVPVLVIPEPTILSLIPEISIVTPVTTLPPPPSVTIIPALQQQSTPIPTLPITTVALKDVQELKEVDHTATHLASLRSKIPSAVNAYIGSSPGDALQKVLQKHTKELKQQYSEQVDYKDVIEESMQANVINEVKNLLPKFLPMALSDFATSVIQSNVKKALEKTPTVLAQSSSQAQSSLKAVESLTNYELKTILFKKMNKSRSYLTHDKHQALFNSLLNSICLDDIVARGQANLEKILKKRDHDGDDKDEDPSARPNQGKKTKRRRTKESESSKKSSAFKGNSSPKIAKSDKPVHVEESVDVPTEEVIMDVANDNVVIDVDQPQDDSKSKTNKAPRNNCPSLRTWNFAAKDPLTFDDLMATPFDFSKFTTNRLKIDKLTKAYLVGPVYNLLKGTCQNSIKLEYNIEECYKASSRLTIASEYFFNNDLGYLKSSYTEKKYTTSITKTKAARYELVGIEDMIPSLWSVTKILSVKSVMVNKLHGFGYLEEIVVRRDDRLLYKIKEGDFVNLHLNDIEDMLLLVVQHKLFQLDGSDIVDLAVALLMWADELYKFSDGTLKLVRDELHHKVLGFRLGYNKEMSRRKWLATEKWRSELMVELIDKQMRERRILGNLERLVGAQELKMDYRLMQRTI